MIGLIGFDNNVHIDGQTTALQSCYKRCTSLKLVFDFDAVQITSKTIPAGVKNLQNWKFYCKKELFADDEFIIEHVTRDTCVFLNFGCLNLRKISRISYKGWDLYCSVIDTLWFKKLTGVVIIVAVIDSKTIIQLIRDRALVSSRVIQPQHLDLEIEELKQFTDKFATVVVLNKELATADRQYYPAHDIRTVYLHKAKYSSYIAMALLCLGAYSVPSPRIAAKQALSLQCQALNNAAISQKNMLARQNQRDRCHKSAMSIAGLIAQFSRHGHLIDYKYAEKLTVQFVRSASKSYNLMLDQQARFKSLLQRSFTNVSDAEVVNVDRVNQRFSYRVLDY